MYKKNLILLCIAIFSLYIYFEDSLEYNTNKLVLEYEPLYLKVTKFSPEIDKQNPPPSHLRHAWGPMKTKGYYLFVISPTPNEGGVAPEIYTIYRFVDNVIINTYTLLINSIVQYQSSNDEYRTIDGIFKDIRGNGEIIYETNKLSGLKNRIIRINI